MQKRKKVLLSWSSGKDSVWALRLLRQRPEIEVAGLLTTFNGAADRVAMHAVRRVLVEAQAERVALPLWRYDLPSPCSNAQYESVLQQVFDRARGQGIEAIAYGDLFLQDIREYRERQMSSSGMEAIFPVWNLPTGELAREMLQAGLRARLTCVDPSQLDPAFAGREFDHALLGSLPAEVDPCGERGEFHTFVYAAPGVFSRPIEVVAGELVMRDNFCFADLLPAERISSPGPR